MSKYVAFANTITLAISSLVKIYLILSQASLLAFALVGVFDALILALGMIYFYIFKTNHSLKSWRFDRNVAKYLFSDSWPLIIGSTASAIYMNIDQIMIKEFSGNINVGYYAVAVKLSTIWTFITVTIVSSLSPHFTKVFLEDERFFNKELAKIYGVLVKISFCIALITFILADYIVEILYGNLYKESVKLVKMYVWIIILIFLSNASWLYYINKSLSKIASYRLIIGAIVNIFLNLLLIPLYSIEGAIISTIISSFISSYLINIFFDDTRNNFWLQTQALKDIFVIKSWYLSYYIRGSNDNK
jgi:O-antigen/teichoic acid export membrane protein